VVLYVECPPAGTLISVRACRSTYAGREYQPCHGCRLGPLRGAHRWADLRQEQKPDQKQGPKPEPALRLVGIGRPAQQQPTTVSDDARWLRQARGAAGMTQTQLGVALGHARGMEVSRLESGHRKITPAMLERLQAILGQGRRP